MKLIFTLLFGLSFTQTLAAHTLPFEDFYPGNQKLVLITAASFELTKDEINTIFSQNSRYFDFVSWLANQSDADHVDLALSVVSAGATSAGVARFETDGQVDHFNEGDAFYRASLAAITTCNAYAVINSANFDSVLVPRFTAPTSFTTGKKPAIDHHTLYQLAQSISFDCVYRVTPIEHQPEHRLQAN